MLAEGCEQPRKMCQADPGHAIHATRNANVSPTGCDELLAASPIFVRDAVQQAATDHVPGPSELPYVRPVHLRSKEVMSMGSWPAFAVRVGGERAAALAPVQRFATAPSRFARPSEKGTEGWIVLRKLLAQRW